MLLAKILQKLGFNVEEENCDWCIGDTFFIWKPNFRGHWGIGRSCGDGIFAIDTPWFMLYLE